MKKFKTWWANVNEPNLKKQTQIILNMLLEIESNKLSLEDSLSLFNMVKSSFDEIVSKKKEQALKDVGMCDIYLYTKSLKTKLSDPNFDKPLSEIETIFEIVKPK